MAYLESDEIHDEIPKHIFHWFIGDKAFKSYKTLLIPRRTIMQLCFGTNDNDRSPPKVCLIWSLIWTAPTM